MPDITREQLAKAITAQARADGDHPLRVISADGLAGDLLARIAFDAGNVVDAHICCDHATDPDVSLAGIAGSHADTELALMAAILHGMEQLDRDARQRIRNWVDERFATARPR